MPVLLNETELQALAALAQDIVLKDSCDLLPAVRVNDPQGGETTTYNTVRQTVACAVITAKPKLQIEMAEQLMSRVYKTLLLPRGTLVLPDDRLRVTSTENGVQTTLTYRVVGLYSPMSFDVVTQVDVIYDASGS